jgi:hypothetical protein
MAAALVAAAIAGFSWLSSGPSPTPERGGSRRADPAASGSDAVGLGALPLDETTLRLYEALFDPELSLDIRAWVVGELGRERGPESTAALVRMLDDGQADLVLVVVDALADRIAEPGVRQALERQRAHSDPRVAQRIEELLETPSGSTARK